MDEDGDAHLGKDATHFAQPPGIPPVDPRLAMAEKLQAMGIDPFAVTENPSTWIPKREYADYRTNHRALLRFYGFELSTTLLEQDMRTRY